MIVKENDEKNVWMWATPLQRMRRTKVGEQLADYLVFCQGGDLGAQTRDFCHGQILSLVYFHISRLLMML